MHGDEVVELLDEVGLVEPAIDLAAGAVVADDLTPGARIRRSPSVEAAVADALRPAGTAIEPAEPSAAPS